MALYLSQISWQDNPSWRAFYDRIAIEVFQTLRPVDLCELYNALYVKIQLTWAHFYASKVLIFVSAKQFEDFYKNFLLDVSQ